MRRLRGFSAKFEDIVVDDEAVRGILRDVSDAADGARAGTGTQQRSQQRQKQQQSGKGSRDEAKELMVALPSLPSSTSSSSEQPPSSPPPLPPPPPEDVLAYARKKGRHQAFVDWVQGTGSRGGGGVGCGEKDSGQPWRLVDEKWGNVLTDPRRYVYHYGIYAYVPFKG